MSREKAEQVLAAQGGKVTSSVSKKTSFIVVGADRGTKLAKGREARGVPILDDAGLQRLLAEGPPAVGGADGDPGSARPAPRSMRCGRTRRSARFGECALQVFPPPCPRVLDLHPLPPEGRSRRGAARAGRGRAEASIERRRTRPERLLRRRDRTGAEDLPPLPQEIDIDMDIDQFRSVLRQVLAEELGVTRSEMVGAGRAAKWS